ncbi:MAG: 16S rRNA processing protein RimM [Aestuariivirga sp.]|uniref:ribosome maturation factor RimM n=1 Tax=Aestuariivirga sp. TaxID=2650926 RepID=UPI0025C4C626|nr:ribosome maturation factor RimM [Aestuariivirga sp.]MCA3562697.1 16S rRNA processing protein RimM [Aestuariivirga sp.]
MAPRGMVLVGAITAAHGIRGEVRLRSFTADPAAIASYSPLETASGRKIEIAKLRARKEGFIAILKGVAGRNAAEALRGTELFVPRERLPETGDGEVYVHDLIGMPVHLADGALLGEIVDVADYGAGDLIDVKVEGRNGTVLIPFADQYVLETAEDRIVVDLPEGYLDAEAKREDEER